MTIWKYPIKATDFQEVDLPEGARVLCVQVQGVPCLWALVDPDKPTVRRKFVIHGTGHPVKSSPDNYIGTYQLLNGQLVFHVFEEPI